VVPFDLKFKLKKKNFEKGYARVYRGNTLLETLSLKEESKSRKYKFRVDISKYLFHFNDELRIEIVGVDYFHTEKVLYKTNLEALQINYNIIPERRKVPKTVKGLRIKRAPKKK
jgi:hypothetical protein